MVNLVKACLRADRWMPLENILDNDAMAETEFPKNEIDRNGSKANFESGN